MSHFKHFYYTTRRGNDLWIVIVHDYVLTKHRADGGLLRVMDNGGRNNWMAENETITSVGTTEQNTLQQLRMIVCMQYATMQRDIIQNTKNLPKIPTNFDVIGNLQCFNFKNI